MATVQPDQVSKQVFTAASFTAVAFAACLVANLLEFLCFVVLLLEMRQHHKRHVSLCLYNKPAISRQKKRRNVITTAGHFASWLVEMFFFGVIPNILLQNMGCVGPLARRIFLQLLPGVNYAVFPLVQALSSQDLREHIFSLEFCKQSCMCHCKPRTDSAEIPQEMELQVVVNGHVIQGGHSDS